jgi:hypothetical protein
VTHSHSLTLVLTLSFPQKLRELVCDCWEPDAEKRPSFEDIVTRLEEMLKELPKHTIFNKSQAPGDCCVVS